MMTWPAAGGDLCSAIQADTQGELLWYGLGHRIALDIARGLFFLHSHEVRQHLAPSHLLWRHHSGTGRTPNISSGCAGRAAYNPW
jgi:hypothetical protein